MKTNFILKQISFLFISFMACISFNSTAIESTKITSKTNVSYEVPKAWLLEDTSLGQKLSSPKNEVSIYLSFGKKVKSIDKFLADAWQDNIKGFSRTLVSSTEKPKRQGWDSVTQYDYKTSPSEKVYSFALVFKKANEVAAILVEDSQAEIQRRWAEISLVNDTIKPAGYTEEKYALSKASPLSELNYDELAKSVEEMRRYADIPGVAISLFSKDEIMYAKGFGQKRKGSNDKVTVDSRFMIASNTKALTTLLIAKLVDEGKFDWDTPVVEVYPEFKLGNDETTPKVLMKHLVCACTGLPRQDFEWLLTFAKSSPEDQMARLATMVPTTDFGALFQYSNPLASAAGYVAAYSLYPNMELGSAYDKAMQEYVFNPLGMKETTFSFEDALAGNIAWPHSENARAVNVPAKMDLNYSVVPVRPAGGAWSNVIDYAKYLQMELAEGKVNDQQYINADTLLERRKPNVGYGKGSSYGMGLSNEVYKGINIVEHGGSMIGYKSNFFIIPELGIGGIILTNADNGYPLTSAIRNKVLEMLFDGKPEAEEKFRVAIDSSIKQTKDWTKDWDKQVSKRVTTGLANRYTNAILGELRIKKEYDEVFLAINDSVTLAVTEKENPDKTISLMIKEPGFLSGELSIVNKDKKVSELILRDSQHEYIYRAED